MSLDKKEAPLAVTRKASNSKVRSAEQVDTIQVFPRGVKTVGFMPREGLPEGAGGVRGEISGWSAASRRRFREWLLTHESSTQSWGVTLTIPGETVAPDDWKKALNRLSTRCTRAGVGLVWRLELQTRGQPHIHCIATTPRFPKNEGGESATESTLPAYVHFWWWETWSKIIDKAIPECAGRVDLGGNVVEASKAPRSLLLGADRYAVCVEPDTGGGLWWRYLCDHATKSKQAQVCTWANVRHWGRFCASSFREVEPENIAIGRKVFVSVYRWIRNSTRRRIQDERAPFGSRKGVSPRRSCAGSSVWFGVDPETVGRLLSLAAENMAGAGAALAPVKASQMARHDERIRSHNFRRLNPD